MTFYSAEINGIHMMKAYKMALAEMHCVQPPEPKSNIVDIPGADGSIDLSTIIAGHPVYKNRRINMKFGTGRKKQDWPILYSEIQKRFNGKTVKVVFDDDRGYYYTGRATVSDYSRMQTLGTLIITVAADPYKYEVNDGSAPWLWDSFSFVDGIIRDYSDISILGKGSIVVVGRDKYAIPEVICSSPMELNCENRTFNLRAGHTKLYDCPLAEGEHELRFTGNGVVSVIYRGGVM